MDTCSQNHKTEQKCDQTFRSLKKPIYVTTTEISTDRHTLNFLIPWLFYSGVSTAKSNGRM